MLTYVSVAPGVSWTNKVCEGLQKTVLIHINILQQILEERSGKEEHKRSVCMFNKSQALLGGNIFCGHCGSRMIASRRTTTSFNRDGTEIKNNYGVYICYHSSRKLNDCDGQTTYRADRIEGAVLKTVHMVFENIAGCPEEEKIELAYKQTIELNRKEQVRIKEQLAKDTKQLDTLRAEIANALTGNSIYSSEDLATAIQTIKDKISDDEHRLKELILEEGDKKRMSEGIIPAYRRFRSWALEFDESSFERKKMIICELFNRIEIGRNYIIKCELNFTYKQFCTEWATLEEKITATA